MKSKQRTLRVYMVPVLLLFVCVHLNLLQAQESKKDTLHFSGPFGRDSLRWHEWFRSHARSWKDSAFYEGFTWPGFPELELDFWDEFTYDTLYWRHRFENMLNNPEIFREELMKRIEEARREMERYFREYRMRYDTLYYPGDEVIKKP